MGRRGNQARPLKVELSFQVQGIGKTKSGGGILTPAPSSNRLLVNTKR